jgi:hypothetical protein
LWSLALSFVVLSPYGTFVCEEGNPCETAPDELVGFWQPSVFGFGQLRVYGQANESLKHVETFNFCVKIIPRFYRCGTPKSGSVVQ